MYVTNPRLIPANQSDPCSSSKTRERNRPRMMPIWGFAPVMTIDRRNRKLFPSLEVVRRVPRRSGYRHKLPSLSTQLVHVLFQRERLAVKCAGLLAHASAF